MDTPPLLGLGGAEKVENLKKVKLKEHILIITEFMVSVQ
ncbi:T6SS immunity protein Tdi1 domain-containing protein [Gracilibacillus boraciitolerans]|nr:T6SS immunity protein Tdi1 domain-containing protein [Gracilibacillus boraciitolerans]